MKQLEKALIIAGISGVIMHLLAFSGGSLIMMISLALLSTLYMVPAFLFIEDQKINEFFSVPPKEKTRSQIITGRLSGITLSILSLAFIFGFQLWAGGALFAMMGLFLSLVCIILSLFLLEKDRPLKKNILVRIIPFFIAVTTLTFYPTKAKINLIVHDPALREIRLRLVDNPYDPDAQRDLDEYTRILREENQKRNQKDTIPEE